MTTLVIDSHIFSCFQYLSTTTGATMYPTKYYMQIYNFLDLKLNSTRVSDVFFDLNKA